MELKSQVVSLELSKRLKELGVKQASLFYWCSCGQEITQNKVGASICGGHKIGSLSTSDLVALPSAFTVAELGEMLPNFVESYKSHEDGFNWFCRRFVEGDISKYDALQTADTEADARAKMLIYLLENKLITL